MRQDATEFEQHVQNGKVPQPVAEWVAKRRAHQEPDQIMPLLSLVFQEDMLGLAVEQNGQDKIQIVGEQFIQGELGVEFSTKPEAKQTIRYQIRIHRSGIRHQ